MPSLHRRWQSTLVAVMVVLLVTGALLVEVGSHAGPRVSGAPSTTLVRSISLPAGGRLDHLSEGGDGQIYLAALGNNSLLAVNPDGTVRIRAGFAEPQNTLYVSQEKILFVSNGGDGTVDAVNPATLVGTNVIQLGSDADNMGIDNSGRVYIGYGSGGLAIIDPAKMALVSSIALPGHPEAFQIESGGPRVFVNVPAVSGVVVLDRSKLSVLTMWPLVNASQNYPMALDEKDGKLFVGTRVPPLVTVLDTATGKDLQNVSTCADADDIFYAESTSLIYVVCGDGHLQAFKESPIGLSLIASVTTSQGARTGRYDEATGLLYVAAPSAGRSPARLLVFGPAHWTSTTAASTSGTSFLIEVAPQALYVGVGESENYSVVSVVPLGSGVC